jgi:hypothetical protein
MEEEDPPRNEVEDRGRGGGGEDRYDSPRDEGDRGGDDRGGRDDAGGEEGGGYGDSYEDGEGSGIPTILGWVLIAAGLAWLATCLILHFRGQGTRPAGKPPVLLYLAAIGPVMAAIGTYMVISAAWSVGRSDSAGEDDRGDRRRDRDSEERRRDRDR